MPDSESTATVFLGMAAEENHLDDLARILLDYVALHPLAISLLSDSALGELLNKRSHGRSLEDVSRKLAELSEREWIRIGGASGRPRGEWSRESLSQLLTQHKHGPNGAELVDYRLTATGGEQWQSFSLPDWRRFVAIEPAHDNDLMIVEAGSSAALEAFIEYDRFASGRWPIGLSIKTETIEPWHATYWKLLQLGHRATYRFEERPPLIYPHRPARAREWFFDQDAWCQPPVRHSHSETVSRAEQN